VDAVTLGFMLAVDFFLSWEGLKYKGDIQFFSAGILAIYALATVAADDKITVAGTSVSFAPPSQDFNLWIVLFALLAVANFASIIEAHTRKEPQIG